MSSFSGYKHRRRNQGGQGDQGDQSPPPIFYPREFIKMYLLVCLYILATLRFPPCNWLMWLALLFTHDVTNASYSGHSHFGQNGQEEFACWRSLLHFAFVICSAKSSCNYLPCSFCKSCKPAPYHVAPLLVIIISLIFHLCGVDFSLVRVNKEIRDRFLSWSHPNFSYKLSICNQASCSMDIYTLKTDCLF